MNLHLQTFDSGECLLSILIDNKKTTEHFGNMQEARNFLAEYGITENEFNKLFNY